MSNPRVLCLGEILYDMLADQLGRSPSEVESWTAYPGGAPANVACGLVKLGTPSAFIGVVGEDEAGNNLQALLQEIGVDTTGVQRHPQAPTRQVLVVRKQNGDRVFAGFKDYDTTEFADTHLKAGELPEELFASADFLVLGTLELAYPDSGAAVHRALELACQYDVKILLDVNWRSVFWTNPDAAPDQIRELIKKVDFLKLAKEEAELLFDTHDAGAITYRLNSVEGVLVTDGDKGCAYCLGENEDKFSAFSVPVIDTTGAGDSFVAGFVHQLLDHGVQNLNNPEIAKKIIAYACAAGALTTLKPGAIASQPTASEIESFLKEHQI
ncbi:carbohydrate kinase [Plectonema cf. radiosum LEGE 06105]|uniref:Carbohydrate kinase n=1 Tax=Plectonema cf. radiosum LEGE 06105 TaxID=945769 RepID=A0A8J7F7I7_9CYAN|nr:carbohydrate kinase [Plectonema radiosum]MBE9213474.1 carbohydrate kinase [Plectonema cf. radiosum LEGE 06105]